jgi:hypothetical protein
MFVIPQNKMLRSCYLLALGSGGKGLGGIVKGLMFKSYHHKKDRYFPSLYVDYHKNVYLTKTNI